VFLIVNPEWETARQHAMEFEMQRMICSLAVEIVLTALGVGPWTAVAPR
jgi:hypothetical protein